jgi:T-complex protein 1 subunit theta
VTGK